MRRRLVPPATFIKVTAHRPFLLLSTRPEDEAAAEELESFATAMRVRQSDIEQRRLEQEELGSIDLDAYSGVLLGGSPFNNLELRKSQLQLRVEREIGTLIAECIDRSRHSRPRRSRGWGSGEHTGELRHPGRPQGGTCFASRRLPCDRPCHRRCLSHTNVQGR